MKKREVAEMIYQALSPVLAACGFRLKKSDEGFVRRIPDGNQWLGVAIWDRAPVIEFSLVMSIRIDAAEEITNLFSGSPPKYHPATRTVLTQLEHLGRASRWKVTNEGDLAPALAEVCSLVQDRIVPFFERYQDTISVASAANPDIAPVIVSVPGGLTTGRGILADRVLFSSGNHTYRAMSAITLAYLTGMKNFEALVQRYRDELLPLDDEAMSKFDRLVEFLKERKDP